jgi:uncharacterized membrane protein
MKKILIALTLIVTFLFAATAFAADQNVRLSAATTVAGTKLAPGEYTVRYQINGNSADVKIIQGKKELVSTKAEVVELPTAAPYDGVVRVQNSDGTSSIREIQMANKKQAIRLEGSDTAVGK